MPISEVFECEDFIYIVIEYFKGGDLSSYLKKKELTEHETQMIMHQLFQALQYLSNRGIIHRDIKPGNILLEVDPDNKAIEGIKVADFGLSRIL